MLNTVFGKLLSKTLQLHHQLIHTLSVNDTDQQWYNFTRTGFSLKANEEAMTRKRILVACVKTAWPNRNPFEGSSNKRPV